MGKRWAEALIEAEDKHSNLQSLPDCLRKAEQSRRAISEAWSKIASETFKIPSWKEIAEGKLPPNSEQHREVGEWSHGWQFEASRILDIEFKKKTGY